jgi:hypothetical protein
MGKWATYQKRGGGAIFGSIAAPGPAPTDFTAVTGGVGVITVTRVAAIPSGATGMNFRAIDTTTNLVAQDFNGTLTGLISARVYKVQAAWFNGALRVSEASPGINVAAG